MKDSWLANTYDNKDDNFYDTRVDYYLQQEYQKDIKPLLFVEFFMDDKISIIERKVYTILDAVANTGGMIGAIYTLFGFFVSLI